MHENCKSMLWFFCLCQSPADMSSKIEKGDEVLQVNGQTVVSVMQLEIICKNGLFV